ncbi:MAG TPA: hypothetical protein VKZ61_05935 [Thermomicrobiales bacterium]|jgi:hypothetical protein|nr:hypothetical protein [Thermomicrobiales bacterium]
MMHPELMHIIAKDIQKDRRREATEPLDMPFTDSADAIRRTLGKVMVTIGLWLGGSALRARQNPSPQEA